jgi:hypothetical protein
VEQIYKKKIEKIVIFYFPENVSGMGFLHGPDHALTVTGVKVEVRPYKPCGISNAV